jgi:putative nucleotidyltransferase with HDIG domain
MDRISVISDSVESFRDISSQMAGIFETQFFHFPRLPYARPEEFTVVDINFEKISDVANLRLWLQHRPENGRVIFAFESGDHYQEVQAYAIGATDLIPRPIDRDVLITQLLGDIEFLDQNPSSFQTGKVNGISAGVEALKSVFASARLGAAPDPKIIATAGETVVSHIETGGLLHWIDIVRKHHSQTYQHCLLVTGVAVAFGRHLGFFSKDQQKLAFAGLLHDVGKARVPVAILEKTSLLDDDEIAIMQKHPQFGFDALQAVKGIDPEMLDMVVHHHEYLDGSGYPHGLQAHELSDFVRLMTIADIFGALIERRAYKVPLSGNAAYQILTNMGSRLDRDLVREFRPVSLVIM